MHFGYKVLNEESVKAPKSKIKSKERPGEKYETSRWTPLLQDIAEVFSRILTLDLVLCCIAFIVSKNITFSAKSLRPDVMMQHKECKDRI